VDSRDKIVRPGEAAEQVGKWKQEGASVAVVRGTFDPLLAVHVRELERLAGEGSRVVVFVIEGNAPILPPAVRVELVAALRCVELAAAGEPAAGPEVHDLVAADEIRTAEFIEHVHRRNQA